MREFCLEVVYAKIANMNSASKSRDSESPRKYRPYFHPRKLRWWRNIGLIFLAASIGGRFLEVLYAYVLRPFLFSDTGFADHWFMPAEPYGFGAIAVLIFLYPIARERRRWRLPIVYAWSVILSGVVEIICGLVIILVAGRNRFWNYTNQPFNLLGQTRLRNDLLFGAAATAFVYLLPAVERILKRLPQHVIDATFWLLLTYYVVCMIATQVSRYF